MAYQLPKLSDADFEVDYARNLCFSSSSSSTGSSGASSPSSSSTSSSNSAHSKKDRLAAPQVNFLHKKRTAPVKFCPKARAPTNRFQPAFVEEKVIIKVPHIAKPLQHIHKRPLLDSSSNKNMQYYKKFRELERQKAQAAKLDGSFQEPPQKKRAQRKRREF